eukprot:CAMPEP_0194733454 /NCGR_PEP_ID=MMETSP0296-20130528/65337_1 /TAXON_ID=39354 /ORGANISM="Heterosigma akashiwo, Strain CCMP2393" /LENGTH=62 /DNA_ID=CAMNT_0039641791 /DNA_START=10 /DNA_END=198 /DNA_ORIENTATION=+
MTLLGGGCNSCALAQGRGAQVGGAVGLHLEHVGQRQHAQVHAAQRPQVPRPPRELAHKAQCL